jgi:hypothetical protein
VAAAALHDLDGGRRRRRTSRVHGTRPQLRGERGRRRLLVTGTTPGLGIERRFALSQRFDLAVVGRFAGSWATVPVAGGEASAPDRSLHLLVGIGIKP